MKYTVASTFFSTAILALTAAATPHKRATYSGHMTPIGNVTGDYASCGNIYQPASMFVAVDPSLLTDCGATITINCPTGTVTAQVVDKCMGCDPTHIDVAYAVYDACGGVDGGVDPIENISWSF